MNLPKNPVMLLSVINTELRDHYSSFEELAKAHTLSDEEKRQICDKLEAINYAYDESRNQFV